ncbi:MAG: hypothetical protein ABSC42_01455 [Tepidisphaeraceae bacterium]|jgi:hypothetical protein
MTPDDSQPPQKLPGNGLLGWLGRQVAYIRNAMKTNVAASKTLYRDCKIEEMPLPQDPKVKLRRTVIDEVVVDRDPPPSAKKKTP